MTNKIPDEVFSLSPPLTRQHKSHNAERAASVDSLLSLPRRKNSPKSIRRTLDLYIPTSISEGELNAQWNVKGGTPRREADQENFKAAEEPQYRKSFFDGFISRPATKEKSE
jgi:hypothetical protein